MLACALATQAELNSAVDRFEEAVGATDLRVPETGLVMMRGRIGGTGAPFNVGEVTVSRAAVQLPDRTVGFGYQMGRSILRARSAAIIDALGQEPGRRSELEKFFVGPVLERARQEDAAVAAEGAATRVNFFTLARGEDDP